jgi:protein phosphatase
MQVVNYAVQTEVGKVRDHNEDCYRVNTALGLYIIADGMGGHASGEVASKIAVDTIELQVDKGMSLKSAIECAHSEIIEGVKSGAGKSGMGTTVIAAQLKENNYTLAWVGDSRAYLWDENLVQLSSDHSLVQMLIDSGQITKAEARVHPRKNIIYQNLGSKEIEKFQVSQKQGLLYKNQKLILCSDGLSDELDDDEISKIIKQAVQQEDSNKDIVTQLIDAALKNGGRDNVTVIIVSVLAPALEKSIVGELKNETNKDTLIPEE